MEILATTLLTLPTLAALALFTTYFDTGRRLSQLTRWAISVGACVIALLLAWALPLLMHTEVIIGNWFPVSVTFTPLVIQITPEGVALTITVMALMTAQAFNQSEQIDPLITLRFAALALAALSNNLITLLVGIGLNDAMTILATLRSTQHPDRVTPPAIMSALSLTLIFAAILVYTSTNQSLYYPLVNLSERAAALALAGCLLRFVPIPFMLGRTMIQSSSIGGWILLIQFAKLSDLRINNLLLLFYLLCAGLLLGISVLSTKRSSGVAGLNLGALCLCLIGLLAGQSRLLTAAAITWLLGTALLSIQFPSANQLTRRKLRWSLFFARTWGGLNLIGFPLTAGFIAHAGMWTVLLNRPRGWLYLSIWFIAQALLVFATLRLMAFRAFRQTQPSAAPEHEFPLPIQRIAALGAIASLGLPLLALGLYPQFIGAVSIIDSLSQHGLLGWSLWVASIGIGILLWVTEPRWRHIIGERDVAWGTLVIRDQLAAFLSLNWLGGLLQGALRRIAAPFSYFFTLVESDGALIWAIIIVLLTVLINFRPSP